MSSDYMELAGLALQNQKAPDSVRLKQQMDALRERLDNAGDKDAKLKEACEGFEAIFLSKIWQQMRNSIPKDGYLHSRYEDMYMSMFDQEFAQNMAGAGGLGLGDMLFDHLRQKLQMASQSAPGGEIDMKPFAQTYVEKGGQATEVRSLDEAGHAVAPLDIAGVGGTGTEAAGRPVDPGTMTDAEVQERVAELARSLMQQAGGAVRTHGTGSVVTHWPVDGEVVKPFGAAGGNGLDSGWVEIAARPGSEVQCCRDGLVSYVGEREGLGRVIEIEHAGGFTSQYAGTDNHMVREGMPVRGGQVIAEVAMNDTNLQPTFRFKVSQEGVAWNPASGRKEA